MRRILVDSARARGAHKRAREERSECPSPKSSPLPTEKTPRYSDRTMPFRPWADPDERKSRVVELRFFGGLSVAETAAVLDISGETVMRGLESRAWRG